MVSHQPTSLARVEWSTPVVNTTTERDALFPVPVVNQRVQNLQTQAYERWTGSSWIPDISYPIAGVSGTTPVVADNTARDALFPSPALNQRVQNLGTGTFQRYTADGWIDDLQFPAAAVPVVDTTPVVAKIGRASCRERVCLYV